MQRTAIRPARLALGFALALSLAVLSGCAANHPGQMSVTAPSSQGPTSRPSTATIGSVAVVLTSPVGITGHAYTRVQCRSEADYRASAAAVSIEGTTIALSVHVAGFSGAGDYTGVVGLSVTGADGTASAVGALQGVAVQLTDKGGSFAISATGSGGRLVAGNVQWFCG